MEHRHSPQLLAHCPLCQTAYQQTAVRLLGEKGTTRLFHCTCGRCGHAVLAVVLESSGAVSSMGVVTDMEVQDAIRFQGRPPVSSDECIAIHQLLESESQGFCVRLLDKKA
jgi:hypothetical protein